MDEELLLQDEDSHSIQVHEEGVHLPNNISPQMLNVTSVMANNIDEQMKQMELLDRNSFDEKDFKDTLHQFKEFCIQELQQLPQNGDLSSQSFPTDRSFLKMQQLFDKNQQPITQPTINNKYPSDNSAITTKQQHFMAVPIKVARFNVDNRTFQPNKYSSVDSNKGFSLDGGVSQSEITSPKRKALLLKAGSSDYQGVIKMPGSSILNSPSQSGSVTNQYQQPHYLKTKYEMFQKLITNNQIKRCQLEQIMFNDRVKFHNNPLITTAAALKMQKQTIHSSLKNQKARTKILNGIERRGSADLNSPIKGFKSPNLQNYTEKLDNKQFVLDFHREEDQPLLKSAYSQKNVNIQLQYNTAENIDSQQSKSQSIKQQRQMSANYNISFQKQQKMLKPGSQSKSTRIKFYQQSSLINNASAISTSANTKAVVLSSDLQHIVNDPPQFLPRSARKIFRRDIQKVLSNAESTEDLEQNPPPTQVNLTKKITINENQNDGFSRFFNYQNSSANNSPLKQSGQKTSYNGMYSKRLQSQYGSSRKATLVPSVIQQEIKQNNNLIFGSVKREGTNGFNSLLHKFDMQSEPTQSAPRRVKINHLPQKSVFANSYLMKGGNILNLPKPKQQQLRPNQQANDFALINEVENFIAQFQTSGSSKVPIDYGMMMDRDQQQQRIQQRRKLLQSRYDNMSVERVSAVLRESINNSKTIAQESKKEALVLSIENDNPLIDL